MTATDIIDATVLGFMLCAMWVYVLFQAWREWREEREKP